MNVKKLIVTPLPSATKFLLKNEDGETLCIVHDFYLTRPLKLWGHDPDPPIVAAIKIWAGFGDGGKSAKGFKNRTELDTLLKGITDAEALAAEFGADLDDIVNRSK